MCSCIFACVLMAKETAISRVLRLRPSVVSQSMLMVWRPYALGK
jgi:hypothetical protein